MYLDTALGWNSFDVIFMMTFLKNFIVDVCTGEHFNLSGFKYACSCSQQEQCFVVVLGFFSQDL